MATTHLNSLHLQFASAYGDEYVAGGTTAITAATENGRTWSSIERSRLVVRSINQLIKEAAIELMKSSRDSSQAFARLAAMFPEHVLEINKAIGTVSGGNAVYAEMPSDLVWLVSVIFRYGSNANSFLPIHLVSHPDRINEYRRNLSPESRDQPVAFLQGKLAGGKHLKIVLNETTTGILTGAGGNTDILITYIRSQAGVVVDTDPDIWISDIWDAEIIRLMVHNARYFKNG